MGTDLHGQDVTKAACRAVDDAVRRSCLCGLREICGLTDFDQIGIEVKVAVPWPHEVNRQKVLDAVPFGRKSIEVVEGGMKAPGLMAPELGDTAEDAVVALAAVVVRVD